MEKVNLANVLVKEAVIIDCNPFESKDEMFKFMVSKFEEAKIVSDSKSYLKSLYEREELGSTYMGNYIGLPHGRSEGVVRPGIGFCKCKVPFEYESFGEKGKVKYVFMLAIASYQNSEEYMRVLATLAGYLVHDEFISGLDKCRSYEELIELIKNFDNK
ncbi:MAG: PTS sugar transporter subunit IIA [Erysipelotrichaceae bacterium]|nr:PTS sugar transporter subunit IIA [Erysipelotrichaceae bacterium]